MYETVAMERTLAKRQGRLSAKEGGLGGQNMRTGSTRDQGLRIIRHHFTRIAKFIAVLNVLITDRWETSMWLTDSVDSTC